MFSRFFGAGHSKANQEKKSKRNQSQEDESDDPDNQCDNDDQLSKLERRANALDDQDNDLGQEDEDEEDDLNVMSGDNPLLPEELCEIPTFLETRCCDKKLIQETRILLKKKFSKRPENFLESDIERMLNDDWTVSRFLLRCRLDPKRSAKLMEQCGKFRLEFKMGISKPSDFPIEFYKAGGLFRYAPDRVGNETIYMRIKMHRRTPELSHIMKSFILCILEQCDQANNGRGTAVIFDLTDCGLQNVDPSFLFWLVYSFRNYCPKGLSYIVVYNLPWILNATAKLALSWLSSTNKRRLRFTSGDGIQDFIAPENLPDYLGGTCKLNYRAIPAGSLPAEETCEESGLTKEQARKICEVYAKFLKDVDGHCSFDKEEGKNSR